MDLFSLLPYSLAGSLLGVLTGIIPGIGPAQVLAVGFMALLTLNPLQLAVFYIGLITVSQYIDSIPAVYFGVPGETSAVPAAYEGYILQQRGLGHQSIRLTAIGRIVASSIAVAIAVALIAILLQSTWFFSNTAQAVMLAGALIGVCATGQNSFVTTLILMLLGYVLGKIGFDYTTGQNFLTFGIQDLREGLPLTCVLMGLYVIPLMLIELKKKVSFNPSGTPQQTTPEPVTPYLPTMVRSSAVGWVLGLVPGLSYILSSSGSYHLEKYLRMKKGQYQPGDMHSIVAAETGNTSGAFSTLIPLLLFGIPITVSETILYNMMINSGAEFSRGNFLSANFYSLIGAFAVANIIGIIACWPLASWFARYLKKINLRWLWTAIIILVTATVAYLGWYANQLDTHLTIFALLSILGLCLMQFKLDILPVLFVFLLQGNIDAVIFNIKQFYF
jgi:putative tricarboxylic transport membrane protein